MDKILCRIENGLAFHKVYYYKDDILQTVKEISYDELVNYLVTACHYNDCYNLYLNGNPTFIQSLVEEIQTKEATEYNNSNKKIQIEVI